MPLTGPRGDCGRGMRGSGRAGAQRWLRGDECSGGAASREDPLESERSAAGVVLDCKVSSVHWFDWSLWR